MSIVSLKSLPRNERSSVLSSLGAFLLPTPYESKAAPSNLQRQVLEEIGQRFGYRGTEVPTKLLPAVQKLVLKELSSLMMESKPQDIRARVGQKGLLSPDHYDVLFEPHFAHIGSTMGVSEKLAIRVISKPGAVEHVFPEQVGIIGIPSHSLFAQAHPEFAGCSVLILATRRKSTLRVEGGWLVFHELVGTNPTDSPLKMLERFANHYGENFTVGELSGKFFLLTEVKADANRPTDLLKLNGANSGEVDVRFSFAHSYGILKIGLAFATNVTHYSDDLVGRGVHITRKFNRPAVSSLAPLH